MHARYGMDFKWPLNDRGFCTADTPGVLCWYDEPLLAVGKSSNGFTMIALAFDQDDVTRVTRYLITTLSQRRLRALLNNAITVRSVFRDSEAPVYIMALDPNTLADTVEEKRWFGGDLSDDWLPSRHTRLNLTDSKPRRHGKHRGYRTLGTRDVNGDWLDLKRDHRKSRHADRSNCVQHGHHWYHIISRTPQSSNVKAA